MELDDKTLITGILGGKTKTDLLVDSIMNCLVMNSLEASASPTIARGSSKKSNDSA